VKFPKEALKGLALPLFLGILLWILAACQVPRPHQDTVIHCAPDGWGYNVTRSDNDTVP
jgi:hypothetical protein